MTQMKTIQTDFGTDGVVLAAMLSKMQDMLSYSAPTSTHPEFRCNRFPVRISSILTSKPPSAKTRLSRSDSNLKFVINLLSS